MRGNSGKNISLSGIAKHLVHRWIPLKPTPIFECELTAVFPCTVSFGDFGCVQKAVALSTIFRGAKIQQIVQNTKRILFFRQKYRLIYDFAIVEWYLSRIHQLLYGLKPLYDNMSCIILII